MVACGGGGSGDSSSNPIPTNQAPVISGTPATSIIAEQSYQFSPTATDPDGDVISFEISNLPDWASFDNSNGMLTGTPTSDDVGDYGNIIITVSDGCLSDSIEFSISVCLNTPECDEPEPSNPDEGIGEGYGSGELGTGISASFKVMTFNGQIDQGTGDWKEGREERFYQVIAAHMPDVVGIQELSGTGRIDNDSQQKELSNHYQASNYAVYRWDYSPGVATEDQDSTNKNPILVNTDRFTVLSNGVEKMVVPVAEALEKGYECGFVAPEPINTDTRHVNWVFLEDKQGMEKYMVYNTHMIAPENEPKAVCQHALQSDKLLQLIEKHKVEFGSFREIFTCDCNAGHAQVESIHMLIKSGLVESWQVINPDEIVRTGGVDHVFIKNVALINSYYDDTDFGRDEDNRPLFASDHKAIITEIAACSDDCATQELNPLVRPKFDVNNPTDSDLELIFLTSGCYACHSVDGRVSGELVLEGDDWKEQLINVESDCTAEPEFEEKLKLVVPGEPNNSLLYRKITNDANCGDAMPVGLQDFHLNAEATHMIFAWINGLVVREDTGANDDNIDIADEPMLKVIIDNDCRDCHVGSGASGGLDLSPELWKNNLIDVASSCNGSTLPRVDPGNPQGSLLYQKLIGAQDCGSSMPFVDTLSAADALVVMNWISDLAVNVDAGTNYCNSGTPGVVNQQAADSDCPNLSDYQLFAGSSYPLGEMNGNGQVYELTTPLFTNYAHKHRQIFVPDGEKIQYIDGEDDLEYPVGTIITKTFYYVDDETKESDFQVVDLIETRLLIKRIEGWTRLPYIWQDNGQATLALNGGSKQVSWINVIGETQSLEYDIPNSSQCVNCHNRQTDKPLGPRTYRLNNDIEYANGVKNQLQYFQDDAGILANLPVDLFNVVPRHPVWNDDEDGTLENRALAYLETNCAHCHNNNDGLAASTKLWLNAEQWLTDNQEEGNTSTGVCKKPTIIDAEVMGDNEYDIVPGNAEASILYTRMLSHSAGVEMPLIGKSIVHTEGVALIYDWINSMIPDDCAPPTRGR